MDEAERNIGHHLSRPGFHKIAVILVSLRLLAAQLANVLRVLGILVPDLQITGAEVVFVIIQQFLQAGARNVRQLDFRLLGSYRRLAAFQDVFLPDRADWII